MCVVKCPPSGIMETRQVSVLSGVRMSGIRPKSCPGPCPPVLWLWLCHCYFGVSQCRRARPDREPRHSPAHSGRAYFRQSINAPCSGCAAHCRHPKHAHTHTHTLTLSHCTSSIHNNSIFDAAILIIIRITTPPHELRLLRSPKRCVCLSIVMPAS